jgi:hypothetical protein
MDIKLLVDAAMDFVDKGPTPDKAPWRIVLARGEVMLHVIREFGINPRAWDWRVVFHKLVVPSLYNSNPDVRKIAIEVIIQLYKIVGPEVKDLIQEANLKAKLFQTIIQRMNYEDYIAAGGTGGGGRFMTGAMIGDPNKSAELEQIPEAQDEDVEAIRKSHMSLKNAVQQKSDPRKSIGAAEAMSRKSQEQLQPSEGGVRNSKEMLRASGPPVGGSQNLSQSPIRTSQQSLQASP